MNLHEQTYRIKQMMGLLSEESTNFEDFGIEPIPNFEEQQKIISSVDPKLRQIYFKMANAVNVHLPVKHGKRTKQQNTAAGGAGNSAHLRGLALDIHFDTPQKDLIKKLITIASNNGVLGIGVYRDGEDLHIDIDNTEGKGRRAWGPDYTPSSIPDWAKEEVNKHLSKKESVDLIFMGGLESAIPYNSQISQIKNSTNVKNIKNYHYYQPTEVIDAINKNPNAYVVLYSAACKHSDKISSVMKNKNKLFIVEPYATSGSTSSSVKTAVSSGVPNRNVITGPNTDRGFGVVTDSTSTPAGKGHFDVLSFVGKFIK